MQGSHAGAGERAAEALGPYRVWFMVAALYDIILGLAFFFYVAAHALDEWHDRPLSTHLSDHALLALSAGGIATASFVTALGAFLLSPWIVVSATAGVLQSASR